MDSSTADLPAPTGVSTLRRAFRRSRSAIGVMLGGASLVVLGACGAATEVEAPNRFAAISIVAHNTGGDRGKASATMVVFDAQSASVPSSELQQSDQCVFANVDTTSTVARGQLRAGESIGMTIGGASLTLPYFAPLQRYATPDGSPFTYAAGDEARVTIPGEENGFPAATIDLKLAEPIIPEPVPAPVLGQPLTIRWNGTNDRTAAVILSLRYANPATSPWANEQIYCALVDDGHHDIPSGGMSVLLASPAARRSLIITRWRTNEKVLNDKTLLHIVSTIDTTVSVP